MKNTKELVKTTLRALGAAVLTFNTIFVTRQFILAYLAENKRYTMNIDHYGEAHAEIAFIIILLPIAMYAVYNAAKDILKRYKELARK